MCRHNTKFKKAQNGQSLVEIALVLPVLIIMFLGLIELGMMMRAYLVVVNANREGARLASRGVYISDPSRADGGYDTVAGYVLGAFSGQLPVRTVGANANVGIVITYFTVSVNSGVHTGGWYKPLNSNVYVTGTLQTGDPVRDQKIRNEILLDPQEELERLLDSTRKINEGLSKEPGGVATGHEMIVIEVLYQLPQTLHAPIVEWIFPEPMLLYSRTSMRVGSGRAQ